MASVWKLHGDGRTVEPDAVVRPNERLGWPQMFGLGGQHVLAMFGATVTVPLLTGFPVTATIFWSGIGRVVFALSSATLAEIVRDPTGAWTLAVSCRDVFARGGRAVEVQGPLIEDRARVVHEGFWEPA